MPNVTQKITKDEWESFLLSRKRPPFLQSWNMRAMHEALGEETIPFALRDGETVLGVALGIDVRAKRGHYLYFPYGPVMADDAWQHFGVLTDALVAEGRARGADFLRSAPHIEASQANWQTYSEAGWRRAPIHMLAEHIWWLDISPDEETLMKNFRKTMRNLIRRAGRDGVTIRTSRDPKDVDVYIDIHKDTVVRHGFTPYTDSYFRAQVDAFLEDDEALIFVAEYEGKPIASSIIMFYGDMASYHHGASLSAYRKVPASYLMQWEAIKEAKKRGCTTYNFWGIVPEDKLVSPIRKKPHPFAGVTKFKTGFGGELFNTLPCQDYPLTTKYQATRLFETVRKYRRGFF
jgi:peptidoglycan pentaglycine glycine transferase (the first glycine)